MAHPSRDAFWDHVDFRTQHAEMDAPMLHVGGWYDTFCQGTIDSFAGLREHARTPEARAGQRLIMGPWRHVNWGEQTVGEMDYGPALLEVNPFETRRRFFDHHLRGIDNGTDHDKPVMVFTMGENAWHGHDAWPLPNTQSVDYYLQPDGGLAPTPDPRDPTREIQLHLTGSMNRYMWSINGVRFADAEPLQLAYGERVRITLVNDTMMNHPMHLHGMWSDLETGDAAHIPRKHTVVVQPASEISYLVTVDAPGSWAYHCHLLYHMPGMFREVMVT